MRRYALREALSIGSAASGRHALRTRWSIGSCVTTRAQSSIAAAVAISRRAQSGYDNLQLPALEPISSDAEKKPAHLLLCVTPGLAKDVLSGEASPASKVLEQVFAGAASGQVAEAVTAVVDDVQSSSASLRGSNGLAYLAANPGILELQSTARTLNREGRMRDVAAGFVSSDLSLLSIDMGSVSAEGARGSHPDPTSLRTDMLLASTTFTPGSRGNPSILLRQTWVKSNSGQSWGLTGSIICETASLTLPGDRSPARVAFNALLLPLTVPRAIAAGLGNVISLLATAPEVEPAFAASGELERAVAQFFVTREQFPRPVQAWALVLPEHLVEEAQELVGTDVEGAWSASDGLAYKNVMPLLLRGARLHKVLSGGGGWGKKAGLLSLDPETTFARPEGEEDVFDFAMPGDSQASMLGEVAKVGDYVQFFIFDDEMPTTALAGDEAVETQEGFTLSLGTKDAESYGAAGVDADTDTSGGEDLGWTVRAGHFAALSESGLSISLNGPSERPTRTKVDVPDSVVRVQRSQKP